MMLVNFFSNYTIKFLKFCKKSGHLLRLEFIFLLDGLQSTYNCKEIIAYSLQIGNFMIFYISKNVQKPAHGI